MRLISTFHGGAAPGIIVKGEQARRLQGVSSAITQPPHAKTECPSFSGSPSRVRGRSPVFVLTAGLFSDEHLPPQRSDPEFKVDGEDTPLPFIQSLLGG